MCNDFSCDNLGGIYFSIVFLSLVLCCLVCFGTIEVLQG